MFDLCDEFKPEGKYINHVIKAILPFVMDEIYRDPEGKQNNSFPRAKRQISPTTQEVFLFYGPN